MEVPLGDGDQEQHSHEHVSHVELTERYIVAFESAGAYLGKVVADRTAEGRSRRDVIASIMASLAPTWCSDLDGGSRIAFLEEWQAYVDELAQKTDAIADETPDVRLRRETQAAIREGLTFAIGQELIEEEWLRLGRQAHAKRSSIRPGRDERP